MAEIVMPRLSDSMEEGTVLKWLKSVGDEVAVGDELVEIETDKANMVYESDLAGTIVEVLAQEGDTLPVGETIARVGDASEVVDGGGDGAGARDRAPSTEEQGANGSDGEKVPGPTPAAAPAPSPCASSRGPTAPTATGGSSSTRGSTSASPWRPRTRSSCPPSSTRISR